MSNVNWIIKSLQNLPINEDDQVLLIHFWCEFYNYLESSKMCGQESNTKSVEYNPVVFEILNNGKASLPLSEGELRNMEMDIEDLTLFFDEESIFKTAVFFPF